MRRVVVAVASAVLALALLVLAAAGCGSDRPGARFIAYRGPHRIGDMIGPNARVVAVDAHANPTSVVSTDGRPPIVWAFEMASAATVRPRRGRTVHTLDPQLWAHPACPSALCDAGTPRPFDPLPPPPRAIDPCPAIRPSAVAHVLGAYSVTEPAPGSCVWNGRRAGVELEIGGPAWWPYLLQRPDLYHRVSDDTLTDARNGLRVAVRRGATTAVLLTYADTSLSRWLPLAQEAAAWAASH